MGAKLMYDSSCVPTDKTFLMEECELPTPTMPKHYSLKIPVGVLNRLFADVDWNVVINKTRFRDFNNLLCDIGEYKVYRDTSYEGVIVVRIKYSHNNVVMSESWAFFK